MKKALSTLFSVLFFFYGVSQSFRQAYSNSYNSFEQGLDGAFGQGFSFYSNTLRELNKKSTFPSRISKVSICNKQNQDSIQGNKGRKAILFFLSNELPWIQYRSDVITYSRIISVGDITEHVKFKKVDADIKYKYSPGFGARFTYTAWANEDASRRWLVGGEVSYSRIIYSLKVQDTTSYIQVFQPNIYFDTCVNCLDSRFTDQLILFTGLGGIVMESNRSRYGLNLGISIGNLVSEMEFDNLAKKVYSTTQDRFDSDRWSFFIMAEAFFQREISKNYYLFIAPGTRFGLTEISSDYTGSQKIFRECFIKTGCIYSFK